MLVLKRRFGEAITIGDNILVRVVALEHGFVRLAIEAPRDMPVDREEISQKRKERDAKREPE